jgi:RNA polymerase sigma-70 factor, ECF subfamily
VTTASLHLAYDRPIAMMSSHASTGIAELYERHADVVYRAALRVTGNPADAEDVLQTVFLRVLAGAPTAGAPASAAYFRRAAVNAAIDLLRRRAAHAEAGFDEEAPHAAVPPPSLLKEQLRRAIATLDTDDAALFLLRHVEGLSNDELAGLFHLEKNNVAVRLHRIRMRLQTELHR